MSLLSKRKRGLDYHLGSSNVPEEVFVPLLNLSDSLDSGVESHQGNKQFYPFPTPGARGVAPDRHVYDQSRFNMNRPEISPTVSGVAGKTIKSATLKSSGGLHAYVTVFYSGSLKSDPHFHQRQSLFENLKRLNEIQHLPKGWNTYDAGPPSQLACTIAREILFLVHPKNLKVHFITPTGDEGIALKHDATHHTVVTWEIDSDGDIGIMVERPGQEAEFKSTRQSQVEAIVDELTHHG